jgi:hypothetical protein
MNALDSPTANEIVTPESVDAGDVLELGELSDTQGGGGATSDWLGGLTFFGL